jgi:hypothetical protein
MYRYQKLFQMNVLIPTSDNRVQRAWISNFMNFKINKGNALKRYVLR